MENKWVPPEGIFEGYMKKHKSIGGLTLFKWVIVYFFYYTENNDKISIVHIRKDTSSSI